MCTNPFGTARRWAALIVVVLSLGLVGAGARANTLTVNSTADTDDSACDATNCTLREAIKLAQAGDTIVFASPLFDTPQVIHLGSALPAIAVNLTLTGTSANRLTVQRDAGGGSFPVLTINAGVIATVQKVTLTGGQNVNGGGIENHGGLILQDSVVTGNSATSGGGIYSLGDMLIQRSTFSGNSASDGGGLFLTSPATVQLVNTTVSANVASGSAGGIAVRGHGGTAVTLTVTNCTLADNTGVSADSISLFDDDDASQTVGGLRNTILAARNKPNISVVGANAGLLSLGNNLANDDGSSVLVASGDKINTDPMLAPLGRSGGGTPVHVLRLGSPALDAGAIAFGSGGTPSDDQRGVSRPQGASIDIGAVEMRPLIVTSTDDPGDGVCDATCTLRDALLAANADGSGTDDIQFADTPFANAPQVINLASALPSITSNLSIVGTGANRLTLRNGTGGIYAVLKINGSLNVNVFATGVTFADGNNGTGGSGVTTGGGLVNYHGDLTLLKCAVRNNKAQLYGGGIDNNGILQVIDSTISGNSASIGGGLFNHQAGVATVINSTISGNTVTSYAGAIIDINSGGATPTVTLTNSTVAGNNDPTNQVGIIAYDNGGSATVYLQNTIVADYAGSLDLATGGGANGQIVSLGNNLALGDGGSYFTMPGDVINTNPLLATLGNYGGPTQTMYLKPGSPAINAGNDAIAPAADQRGVSRPVGAHVDIGAVEADGILIFQDGFDGL